MLAFLEELAAADCKGAMNVGMCSVRIRDSSQSHTGHRLTVRARRTPAECWAGSRSSECYLARGEGEALARNPEDIGGPHVVTDQAGDGDEEDDE